MDTDFPNYRQHCHQGAYSQAQATGRTAIELPDTDEGIRLKALGYETFEDADMRLDVEPVEIADADIRQHYREVHKYFASTPRYALVCPHCGNIYSRELDEKIGLFRRHFLPSGGCIWNEPKVKSLQPKGGNVKNF